MTRRVGRIEIRRIGRAYDVMFAPLGNGEFRIQTEPALRAFLLAVEIPAGRIEEAVDALRRDAQHAILDVVLTLDRMGKLGL
jgi:hypothetical protein